MKTLAPPSRFFWHASGYLGRKVNAALDGTPSWLASMVVHMVALLALALWMVPSSARQMINEIVATSAEDQPLEDDLKFEVAQLEVAMLDARAMLDLSFSKLLETAPPLVAVPIDQKLDDPQKIFQEPHSPKGCPIIPSSKTRQTPFSGRNHPDKLRRFGDCTPASENAVLLALRWLAAHQMPDGGWSFDLTSHNNCHGKCTQSGQADQARIAATALGVLPFLGAGHTHKEGAYKKSVQAALYFITSKLKNMGGALSAHEAEGTMYSHGLATLALCEAFGMTQDRTLMPYAQGTLNFISYAQDPVGGGWRYEPRTPGDTSVFGWQLLALKSGHLAYLQVPPQTILKATEFLDSVQTDSGSRYGYTGPGQSAATTSIGLLCRMHLGWKRDHPALERGVEFLAERGPSTTDMYYNYYATQVLHHFGGEPFKKWNAKMRDWLVETQAAAGHEAGSWFMKDPHVLRGGRLYCTALATMTLEVYYRHSPIYDRGATTEF